MQLLKTVSEAKEVEAREKLLEGAFIGWQVYSVQPRTSEKDKRVNFSKYLKNLGISDKAEKKQPRERVSTEEALAIAQRIMAADKAAQA